MLSHSTKGKGRGEVSGRDCFGVTLTWVMCRNDSEMVPSIHPPSLLDVGGPSECNKGTKLVRKL